ncbi:hypothetical protein GCM10007921_39120 [Tritonibacter mobilis]|nr:hypothetical protein GCM10007921_39120 [Tritonibacter mobilis]SDY03794.1 probable phosphoglycerate mutase [Tritonibacter mobilis]
MTKTPSSKVAACAADTKMHDPQFLYLRHGQTDWNLEQRLQGRCDPPLNETGIDQARHAARAVASGGVDVIITSPLRRAHQTAQIIAEHTSARIIEVPDLVERNFGALEGKRLVDIAGAGASGYDIALRDDLPGNAEPWDTLCARAEHVVTQWQHEMARQDILFVSHLAVMTALCDVLSIPRIDVKNAHPYRFQKLKDRWDLNFAFR